MSEGVQRFHPTGLLAIDQRAFGVVVSQARVPERKVAFVGSLAIVEIVGPLEHHKGEGYLDSYEDLNRRFAEAFESNAKSVVMKFDSPGGLVAGCFAAALGLRAKRESSGKSLIAFVTGSAASAAYALASQADRIVIAPGAAVGSVGIIDARVDVTKQDAMMGMQYAFIVSGDRKAYGNPHLPLTQDELVARQAAVDANAEVFFDLVAARRPTTPAKLKALQAATFTGQEAISHGLADEVSTFDQLLASIASRQETLTKASAEDTMSAARKALEEAAKGDGDEAKRAKRALAAFDEDEDEKKKDDEAKAKAKAEEEKKEEEAKAKAEEQKKEEEAKAKASESAASSMKALVDEQRRAFLDTRPDLTAEQRASVEGLPMDIVRRVINAIPRGFQPNLAATAVVAATPGAGQATGGPSPNHELDVRMGIVPLVPRAEVVGNVQTFGVMVPKKAEGAK